MSFPWTRQTKVLGLLLTLLFVAVVGQSVFLLRISSKAAEVAKPLEDKAVAEPGKPDNQVQQPREDDWFDFGGTERDWLLGPFSDFGQRGFSPKVDVEEYREKYVVRVDVPGVKESEIRVTVKGQELTITGARDRSSEQSDQDNQVLRRERSTGRFERSIRLRQPVDADGLKADHENGVLTITLPKKLEKPKS